MTEGSIPFHDGGLYHIETSLCKLMDWFLYDTDLRHKRVKLVSSCNPVYISSTNTNNDKYQFNVHRKDAIKRYF